MPRASLHHVTLVFLATGCAGLEVDCEDNSRGAFVSLALDEFEAAE